VADHVTYCFEHLFKEASDDFLDFIQYSDTTVSTPRPLYLTRTEGTQRLIEYLAARQAAREPREPRPPVPDSSDDDSTTLSHLADHRPLPLPRPTLPVPTRPPVMSNYCKSPRGQTNQRIHGQLYEERKILAGMRDLH